MSKMCIRDRANMDLLDPNGSLDLSEPNWKIYSRNPVMPPPYVAKGATVQNSLVAEGCSVYGDIDFALSLIHISPPRRADRHVLR